MLSIQSPVLHERSGLYLQSVNRAALSIIRHQNQADCGESFPNTHGIINSMDTVHLLQSIHILYYIKYTSSSVHSTCNNNYTSKEFLISLTFLSEVVHFTLAICND